MHLPVYLCYWSPYCHRPTVGASIWLLPGMSYHVNLKITFLQIFSHNRCNNMGLPQDEFSENGNTTFLQKYFLTMGTLMIFLLGMIIHMTGRTRTISQLKYLYCLFVECITKFRLNYISDKTGAASENHNQTCI